jgi:hypothetical protein
MINQCEIKYKCYRAYTTRICKYFVQDVVDCKYLDHQLNCNCKEAQKEALKDEN